MASWGFQDALLEARCFDVDTLTLGLQDGAPRVNFALAQFALENASVGHLPTVMAAAARRLKA